LRDKVLRGHQRRTGLRQQIGNHAHMRGRSRQGLGQIRFKDGGSLRAQRMERAQLNPTLLRGLLTRPGKNQILACYRIQLPGHRRGQKRRDRMRGRM